MVMVMVEVEPLGFGLLGWRLLQTPPGVPAQPMLPFALVKIHTTETRSDAMVGQVSSTANRPLNASGFVLQPPASLQPCWCCRCEPLQFWPIIALRFVMNSYKAPGCFRFDFETKRQAKTRAYKYFAGPARFTPTGTISHAILVPVNPKTQSLQDVYERIHHVLRNKRVPPVPATNIRVTHRNPHQPQSSCCPGGCCLWHPRLSPKG